MADLYRQVRLGETRLAVVDRGTLLEMHLQRADDGAQVGSQTEARLVSKLVGRGIVELPDGRQAVLEPLPQSLTEGAPVTVEITRAAWPEAGRPRLAKARPALQRAAESRFAEQLRAAGHRLQAGWPALVADQWESGWEAAQLGRVGLPGGSLGFSPTPALIAVDIDGTGASLAADAAREAARMIRLWGLGGAIVIDFPASPDREARRQVAKAFDEAMGDAAFERTAVNGFGLMQVIRPRTGPSILERARLQPDISAALALLHLAQSEPRPGALQLVARPAVARWLDRQPALIADLSRITGRRVDVRADAMAGDGHVETTPG